MLLGPQRVRVPERHVAVLGPGDALSLEAPRDSTLLLAAAPPLREPVARWGPFVMNTRAEVLPAVEEFRSGRRVRKRAAEV